LQIPDYPSEDEIFLFEYAGGVYSLFCTSGNVYMRPVGAKSGETTTLLAGEATKFGVVRYGRYLVIAYATGSKREVQRLVKIDLEDELSTTVIDSVSIAGLTSSGYCPAVAQDPTTPDNIVWLCGCESTPAEIAAGTPHFYDVNLRAGTISAASFTTIETYTYDVSFEPTEAALCVNPGGSFCYFLKYVLNESSTGNKILFGDCLDSSNPPAVTGNTPVNPTSALTSFVYDSTDACYKYTKTIGVNSGYNLTENPPAIENMGFAAGEEVELSAMIRARKEDLWEVRGRPIIIFGLFSGTVIYKNRITGGFVDLPVTSGSPSSWTDWVTFKIRFKMRGSKYNSLLGFASPSLSSLPSTATLAFELKNLSLSSVSSSVASVTKSRYKADMAVGTGADTTPNGIFPASDRLFSNGIFSSEGAEVTKVRFVDATPAAETSAVSLFGVVRHKATILAVGQASGAYYSVSAASGTITPTALASFPKSGLTQFTADVMYPQFPVAPVSELYERNVYFFRMRNTVSSGQAALSDLVCAMYPQVGG
jgi:hypothetical protein